MSIIVTVIVFIIILAALVLVHEVGHFLVAKWSGIRVDEFGLGFPPRLASWRPRGGETTYSLNAIPFGGFVKIFGESGEKGEVGTPDQNRSFIAKPATVQIAVLVAGIIFNLLFAWLLVATGFMIGLPVPTSYDPTVHLSNVQTTIVSVDPGSPAAKVGLQTGDQIVGISAGGVQGGITINAIQNFTADHEGKPITVSYRRGQMLNHVTLISTFDPSINRAAIGVSLESIGLLRLGFFSALGHGAALTWSLIEQTTVGLSQFFGQLFVGRANLSDVAGPVGIAGLVGQATALGAVYVISFTALISINLALINLIPFPALDGGRILFVIIEKIKGSPIRPAIANTVNAVGFALLILLMLIVTFHDIFRLIH